jgi:hypothetical protein
MRLTIFCNGLNYPRYRTSGETGSPERTQIPEPHKRKADRQDRPTARDALVARVSLLLGARVAGSLFRSESP